MRESESEREAPHDSEVLGSVSGAEVVLTVLWLAWGRSGCVACASARGWGVGRGEGDMATLPVPPPRAGRGGLGPTRTCITRESMAIVVLEGRAATSFWMVCCFSGA